jgi:glutamine cyclotransferase
MSHALPHLLPCRTYPTAWRLLARVPHDPAAFTQGLALHNGRLFESLGLYGSSSLREVALSPARYAVQREARLHPAHFGEGLALWPPAAPAFAIQLLWKGGAALTHALPALTPGPPLRFSTRTGEGWGLAAVSPTALALSDGSNTLYTVAPRRGALVEVRPRVAVFAERGGGGGGGGGGVPLVGLNALCGAHGCVLANVWGQPRVAVVRTGGRAAAAAAAALLDFGALAAENAAPGDPDAVMNGLAYTMDACLGRAAAEAPWGGMLLLTGKRWRWMYAVALEGLQSY